MGYPRWECGQLQGRSLQQPDLEALALILSRTLMLSSLRSGSLEEVGAAGSIYQFTHPWKGWKLPSSGVVMIKLVLICYHSWLLAVYCILRCLGLLKTTKNFLKSINYNNLMSYFFYWWLSCSSWEPMLSKDPFLSFRSCYWFDWIAKGRLKC